MNVPTLVEMVKEKAYKGRSIVEAIESDQKSVWRKMQAREFMHDLMRNISPGRIDTGMARRLARKAFYLADALEAEGERKGRQMRKGGMV